MDGVWVNGNQAVNLFAYDAQGRPLRDVQLFDQDGNPVDIGEPERAYTVDAEGNVHGLVPATDATGRQRWNTYPLRTTVVEPAPDHGIRRGRRPAPDRRPVHPDADDHADSDRDAVTRAVVTIRSL
jgi:hypothetical protein